MVDLDLLPDYVELPDSDPSGRAGFGSIDFERLPNTRDLGGLHGADGLRVRPGMLLRSGLLGIASETDLARLRNEYRLALVVDFRNDVELSEQPDPMRELPDARYVHADIITERVQGITQEAASRERARNGGKLEWRQMMTIFYPHLLLEEDGVTGYRSFFRALLACEDGAALWHCSVGRDRCGMGSMLVECALGVDEAEIEADYLATNLFAPLQLTIDAPAARTSLAAVREALAREWGGVMGYITGALGVTDGEIRDLRRRYLA